MKLRFSNIFKGLSERRHARARSLLMTTSPRAVITAPRSERRAVARALRTVVRRDPLFVRNWYEGGMPNQDGSRSWVPEITQDAKFDQSFIIRREMMRNMRYWAKNSPIFKRGLDVGRQYVIGTHMPVVTSLATDKVGSAFSDDGKTWPQRSEIVWNELTCTAGLNGESLFEMFTVAYDCKKVDGDLLFVDTNRRAPLNLASGRSIMVSRPCLMMVEGHRIETPFTKWDNEGNDIVDGVQYRKSEIAVTGMPGITRQVMQKAAYWVKDSVTGFVNDESWFPVPLENCYLVCSPHRVNQVRGISDFYAVEPTLHLLEDLLKLEMRAQEIQSDLTLFITNGAGQAPTPAMQQTLGALGVKVTKDANGNAVVTQKEIDQVKIIYEKIWGGRTTVGRTGDTMQFLAPNRPAEATLNLWEFLINSFCAGAKLPRILIFPKSQMKGQGTEVRAELEAANAAFIAEFNLCWKPLLHRIWKYFMGWAIKNDPRVADAPDDWMNIEVSPPRSLSVDAGYDSAASLAELAAGVTNLHVFAQRLGTTKSKIIEQSVSDVFDIKLACAKKATQGDYKKFNITVDAAEVRDTLGSAAKNMAATTAAEAQKQNDHLLTQDA